MVTLMSEAAPVVGGIFDADGLMGGACGQCGLRHFPEARHCPWCGSDRVSSVRLATTGTLWSWTAVQSAPPGYTGPVPFGFGVVELTDDGLRVVTLLTEPDPARLHQGDAMVFTTAPVDSDGTVAWAFAPVAR
jgi:uncharacterized OB-fold protein